MEFGDSLTNDHGDRPSLRTTRTTDVGPAHTAWVVWTSHLVPVPVPCLPFLPAVLRDWRGFFVEVSFVAASRVAVFVAWSGVKPLWFPSEMAAGRRLPWCHFLGQHDFDAVRDQAIYLPKP